MIPGDLSLSSLSSALDGARIVYSDVRLHETALLIAQEVIVVFQFAGYKFLFLRLFLVNFHEKLLLTKENKSA